MVTVLFVALYFLYGGRPHAMFSPLKPTLNLSTTIFIDSLISNCDTTLIISPLLSIIFLHAQCPCLHYAWVDDCCNFITVKSASWCLVCIWHNANLFISAIDFSLCVMASFYLSSRSGGEENNYDTKYLWPCTMNCPCTSSRTSWAMEILWFWPFTAFWFFFGLLDGCLWSDCRPWCFIFIVLSWKDSD